MPGIPTDRTESIIAPTTSNMDSRSSVIFAIPSTYLHQQYRAQYHHAQQQPRARRPPPAAPTATFQPQRSMVPPAPPPPPPPSYHPSPPHAAYYQARPKRGRQDQMEVTYAWIEEQERAATEKKKTETARWVNQQANANVGKGTSGPDGGAGSGGQRRHGAAEGIRRARVNVDEEKKREERREGRRELQAEFERMEKRWKEREAREHSEGIRRRVERMENAESQRIRDAWMLYEKRWDLIGSSSSSCALSFCGIPWPLEVPARTIHDITPEGVVKFILSSATYSEGTTRRERIRQALKRWHPDRFARLRSRIRTEDWMAVEYGVGVVVRCLNKLMEREYAYGNAT